jgi:hypothetical protein
VVDDAVAALFLDTITPEQIGMAVGAAEEVAERHTRSHRAAQLAVQQARYEADRAERAFSNVEPENRLIARTLELPEASPGSATPTRSSARAPSPSKPAKSASNRPRPNSASPPMPSSTGCASGRYPYGAVRADVCASLGPGHPGDLPAEGRRVFPTHTGPAHDVRGRVNDAVLRRALTAAHVDRPGLTDHVSGAGPAPASAAPR